MTEVPYASPAELFCQLQLETHWLRREVEYKSKLRGAELVIAESFLPVQQAVQRVRCEEGFAISCRAYVVLRSLWLRA